MAKKRTINLTISEDADTRLRALSAELKLAMGAIIEQAILQWRPDTATPIECMPITDAIEARFNALESRLQALEAERAVKIGAVGIEAVDVACEPVDVAVKIEPAANSTINQSTDDWESAVIKHYNNGVRGWETIAKMTYAAGYQTKNGTMRDGSHVSKVIKATGLKD